jgi:hypothetical protein
MTDQVQKHIEFLRRQRQLLTSQSDDPLGHLKSKIAHFYYLGGRDALFRVPPPLNRLLGKELP